MTAGINDGASEHPFLSVVIPLLDGAETLAQQLSALAAQDYAGAWEVVIADNGSRDAGPELARSFASRLPSLRIVDASGRRGVSHARNCGAREARGEFVLLCDADDVVAPGWLRAMGEAAPRADLLGGSFEEESLNSSIVRRWRPPRPAGELPVALGFMRFAVGSNCGVRASVVRALGGWHESYVGGGNDVEFSWRAQLAGYRLCYVPTAVVHTRYRSSLGGLARQFYLRGRASPRLFRQFRHAGLRCSSLREALRQWLWLVTRLPALTVSRGWRGLWIRRAAYLVGRLCGSLEQRVLFL